MIKRVTQTLLYLTVGLFIFSSCSKDDDTPSGIYSNGAFIINEGNFGHSNASVSFFNFSTDSITNQIFYKANGRDLGDVLNSMAIYNGKAYMVLNNSHKVEIANASDFKQAGVIENLESPRYIAFSGNKAYISMWKDAVSQGAIAVADLSTNAIIKTITVGTGPEGMLVVNSQLWVANCGGYVSDSTIMVIDLSKDTVIKTIVVGVNPQQLVTDKNGNIWVLCSGSADWQDSSNDKPSKLVKIKPSDYTIEKTFEIGKNVHPQYLAISNDKNSLYYGAGYGYNGICKFNIDASSLPTQSFIEGYFYGFSVNPKNGEVYVFDAKDYKSNGEMTRYDKDGKKIKTYTVGLIPKFAIFQ